MSLTEFELDIKRKIEILKLFPYKRGAYASRNWGHKYHSLLSYPSKLKPSIAFFLVNLFTKEGEKVFDPFSGVGTIPFECCSQGRTGIGSDINPIAYHATNAKVNPPNKNIIVTQLNQLERYIEANKFSVNISMDAENEIIPFYHADTLKEILAARNFLLNYHHSDISFLLTCFLHILHGNRPYALSRRSHNIIPWPPKGPFVYKSVIKLLSEKIHRSLNSGLPLNFVKGLSLNDSAFKIQLEDESINCVITSPPFYNNRDFLRMNRLRLWFCGWTYNIQKEKRSLFLEKQKDLKEYHKTFSELYRILKSKSLFILHLGVVKKIDMAVEILPLAEKIGFKKIDLIYEDTSSLESHGIIDRGATQKHQFLILRKN